MGFFDDLAKGVTKYVVDDAYERRRQEVPLEVQYVTDRALVLIRHSKLTPKKMGNLADWDVDVLSWISRERGNPLPGMPAEIKAMQKAAKRALALAVEREVEVHKKKKKKSKAKAGQAQAANWDDFERSLASHLWSMAFDEALILDVIRHDEPYVQFLHTEVTNDKGRRARVLLGEVSGPLGDGDGAGLSLKQMNRIEELGWWPPPDGFSRKSPNFRLYWDSEGELEGDDTFLSVADAEHAAALAVSTLRGPLGVKQLGEIRTRKIDG